MNSKYIYYEISTKHYIRYTMNSKNSLDKHDRKIDT